MKRFFIISLLLLTGLVTFAQGIISGKVINDESGLPLSGASVYINSSTIGTVTNEKGEFVLPIIANGFYDVIVSYVGFELIAYHATIQSKNLQITFKLTKKPTMLRNVVVLSKDGRAKWLSIFKENFLGVTEAAIRCKILNEDEILFEDGNSRDSIKAFSTVPLEIVNKELGYKIYFELVGFYFNPVEGRTFFYGYSRFEELSEKDKVPERFLRNRERYYLGSTMHFFHSLIDGRSKEEGFVTMNVRTVEIGDSATVRQHPPVVFNQDGKKVDLQTGKLEKMRAGFSVNPDYFFHADTIANAVVYKLDWKEQLRVTYLKNPYSKEFLRRRFFLQGGLPLGVFSDVDMLEGPAYMDGNGSLFNPLSVQMRGYWSYEKMANMLPIDYRPNRTK